MKKFKVCVYVPLCPTTKLSTRAYDVIQTKERKHDELLHSQSHNSLLKLVSTAHSFNLHAISAQFLCTLLITHNTASANIYHPTFGCPPVSTVLSFLWWEQIRDIWYHILTLNPHITVWCEVAGTRTKIHVIDCKGLCVGDWQNKFLKSLSNICFLKIGFAAN